MWCDHKACEPLILLRVELSSPLLLPFLLHNEVTHLSLLSLFSFSFSLLFSSFLPCCVFNNSPKKIPSINHDHPSLLLCSVPYIVPLFPQFGTPRPIILTWNPALITESFPTVLPTEYTPKPVLVWHMTWSRLSPFSIQQSATVITQSQPITSHMWGTLFVPIFVLHQCLNGTRQISTHYGPPEKHVGYWFMFHEARGTSIAKIPTSSFKAVQSENFVQICIP